MIESAFYFDLQYQQFSTMRKYYLKYVNMNFLDCYRIVEISLTFITLFKLDVKKVKVAHLRFTTKSHQPLEEIYFLKLLM